MKKIILFFLMFLPIICFAQKEGNIWVMGYGDGVDSTYSTFTMDFNFEPPVVEQRFQDFWFNFSNSSICSSEGNLLFYSNGLDIQNDFDEVIINGDDFQNNANFPIGLPYIQSCLTLPIPNHEEEYLFITSDRIIYTDTSGSIDIGGFPYTYSKIQKNINEEWEVIEKKIPIISDTLLINQLTGVRHANGRDWWVFTFKNGTNQFYRFLVSPSGVSFDGIQEIGDVYANGIGQASFSPDGKWFSRYTWIGYLPTPSWKRVDLYQFDRCTGLFSNHQHELLPGEGASGGVAFSPNSELLYISAWDSIYQYNLAASDILSSRQMVAATDEFIVQEPVPAFTKFFMMQLAPNDKIYISVANISSKYLHVIDSPNELGTACNVLQHHIELPTFNNFSLPNLPHFSLKAEIGSVCDTLRPIAEFDALPDLFDVNFTDESQRMPIEWFWNFGDGDTSTEQNPQHTYSQEGNYEVCLIASNEAGSDTTCQMLDIFIDGIDNITLAQQIKVSPNPTSANVLLEFPFERDEDWQLIIYDTYGRVLLEKDILRSIKKENVLLSDFSSGVYFYELRNANQLIKTGKVVKL